MPAVSPAVLQELLMPLGNFFDLLGKPSPIITALADTSYPITIEDWERTLGLSATAPETPAVLCDFFHQHPSMQTLIGNFKEWTPELAVQFFKHYFELLKILTSVSTEPINRVTADNFIDTLLVALDFSERRRDFTVLFQAFLKGIFLPPMRVTDINPFLVQQSEAKFAELKASLVAALEEQDPDFEYERLQTECKLVALYVEVGQPLTEVKDYLTASLWDLFYAFQYTSQPPAYRKKLSEFINNIGAFFLLLERLNPELWQEEWPFDEGFSESELFPFLQPIHRFIQGKLEGKFQRLQAIGWVLDRPENLPQLFPSWVSNFPPLLASEPSPESSLPVKTTRHLPRLQLSAALQKTIFANYEKERHFLVRYPLTQQKICDLFIRYVFNSILNKVFLEQNEHYGELLIITACECSKSAQGEIHYAVDYQFEGVNYSARIPKEIDLQAILYREVIIPLEDGIKQWRLFKPAGRQLHKADKTSPAQGANPP